MTKLVDRKLTQDHPYLTRLIEKYGSIEAGIMIGVTNPAEIIKRGRVRIAYELAAKMLLAGADNDKLFVVKLKDTEHYNTLVSLLNALKLEYMELDL